LTTITITQETKEKLMRFAEFGESWDEFLSRVADILAKVDGGNHK